MTCSVKVPAAFEAASNIIADYASGKTKVSSVGLENAKASLAYQLISGRSSKLSKLVLLLPAMFLF
jgi:hypothetical protein